MAKKKGVPLKNGKGFRKNQGRGCKTPKKTRKGR